MNREITLVALYDRNEDAQAALQDLAASGIDRARMDIRQASEADRASNAGPVQDPPEASGYLPEGVATGGILETLKSIFIPEGDTHHYAEGVRRGGSLLWVRTTESEADRVHAMLERQHPVDIDERGQQWRESGWTAPAAGSAQRPIASQGNRNMSADADRKEARIPVVEEELEVGKRQVSRGGVRVRSYVVETPVEQQVTLREENISVERRPASGTADAAPGAFEEKTIEMSEVGEEPVVAKKARVREEVVVRKDTQQRTEKVADTVRKTKVDVENTGNPARKRQPAN